MGEHNLHKYLNKFSKDFDCPQKLAIGVSGGGDSMALAHLLNAHYGDQCDIHVLTVDHGLRPEAKGEANFVKETVQSWKSRAEHETLNCESLGGQASKIQEMARNARYELMSQYCLKNDIETLALGHHFDDQIETFFMRLSGGSGLNGLGAMRPVASHHGLTLVRPLLNATHEDCLSYCKENNVAWIEDPSNDDSKYERVRWRKFWPQFEKEGLTKVRLKTTLSRLQDSSDAIAFYIDAAWAQMVVFQDDEISIFKTQFERLPKAVAHKLLRRALRHAGSLDEKGVRAQKSESLYADIISQGDSFKKRTLGGCFVFLSKDKETLVVSPENTK